MKLKVLIMILLILAVTPLWAQDGNMTEERRQEFDAQKVAFFTQALDLTPEEAAAFWPLYNEMSKKMREQEKIFRKAAFQAGEAKELTDAQAMELLKTMQNSEQNLLNIKNEYYQKMVKAISAGKVSKLSGVERKFHRQLFNKIRKPSDNQK